MSMSRLSTSDAEAIINSPGGGLVITTINTHITLLKSLGKPLTQKAYCMDLFEISGNLIQFALGTPLTSDDFAFVNCDSLGGDAALKNFYDKVEQMPRAVVLYSLDFDSCKSDCNSLGCSPVFSTTDKAIANVLHDELEAGVNIRVESRHAILRRQTTANPTDGTTLLGDPTPSTSVALIILYSITGVITALFLLIIVTGAIRAHRHPERYGPRAVARLGQPRQSRAKGLARAVLDTIPIVRFGAAVSSNEIVKSSDIEMQNGPSRPESQQGPQIEPVHNNISAVVPDIKTVTSNHTEAQQNPSQFRCPVCMDDFEAGQDLRVLPCQHQFHPDCIDPWLLNVSGSCPLCRIDLHPEEEPATLPLGEENRSSVQHDGHHASRFSRYLNLARGTSGDERMAALRELREETRRNGQPMSVQREARSMRPELGIGRLKRALSKRVRSNRINEQSSNDTTVAENE
ncbi:hypothetical protein EDC01DRAFT_634420 [Geopyxis carbonaria]|nr:hypothetical protein EDC01DRAFT_634420 [Geopyxis carbonaria]